MATPTSNARLKELLGSLEHAVMQDLWDQGSATVSSVHKRLNESRGANEALAYTTVMTVLVRLTDKGWLSRSKPGRGYQYTPRYSDEELLEHMSGAEVAQLVARYGDAALVHFAGALEHADPDLLEMVIAMVEADE
ncbi:BlaI/MecI/CopY family transcriptional regulator [Euzebya tangerina]|uniref:BlaI/MecI/CopY family transcriptional regulator n=1 Tax=Euzebya tangerina TaxID=591198 RepID=UPI0013C30074|nr:BlaI/MecI/CopY family transcriptional regulator [Euzebya tangerina]